MKISRILPIILVAFTTTGLFSCDKLTEEKAEGSIEFGMSIDLSGQDLKSSSDDSVRIENHAVIVTLGNESGEHILNNERLELYNFGGRFVTNEIKLRTGHYKLLKFMVIDGTGTNLTSTPTARKEQRLTARLLEAA